MKKSISILLFCLFVGIQAQAQTKFTRFFNHFFEAKMPSTISSKDVMISFMDKPLAWEFALQKSPYTKEADTYVMALGYYKVSENVGVFLTGTTVKDTEDATYSVSIQTFQLKTGKLIDEFRTMAGTFSDFLGMRCEVEISNKGNLVISTVSGSSTTKTSFNVNSKGKLKEM